MDSLLWYISGTSLSILCSFANRATLAGITLIKYFTQGNNFSSDVKGWNAVMLKVLIPITCGFYYLKGHQEATKKMAFYCIECHIWTSINYEKDRILISICRSRFLHICGCFKVWSPCYLDWEIQFFNF